MSINVVVRNQELAREFTAVRQDQGMSMTVTLALPLFLRKDRAAMVALVREMANAVLDRIAAEP